MNFEDTGGARVAVIMATHARTAEVVAALESVIDAFRGSDVHLENIYVLADERGETRDETVRELRRVSRPPVVLPEGDGSWYWSRSFAALLRRALSSDADFVLHVNTDVRLASDAVAAMIEPMVIDSTMAAVAGSLSGAVPLTGYRRPRPFYPFFRAVGQGDTADLLPASCLMFRRSALEVPSIDIDSLAAYRHGFADIDLTLQLHRAGFVLATTRQVVGTVHHQRYFARSHNFSRYDGSFVTYVRECPTAPCWSDLRRIASKLFGRWWFVFLRVYAPVLARYSQYRLRLVLRRKTPASGL